MFDLHLMRLRSLRVTRVVLYKLEPQGPIPDHMVVLGAPGLDLPGLDLMVTSAWFQFVRVGMD